MQGVTDGLRLRLALPSAPSPADLLSTGPLVGLATDCGVRSVGRRSAGHDWTGLARDQKLERRGGRRDGSKPPTDARGQRRLSSPMSMPIGCGPYTRPWLLQVLSSPLRLGHGVFKTMVNETSHLCSHSVRRSTVSPGTSTAAHMTVAYSVVPRWHLISPPPLATTTVNGGCTLMHQDWAGNPLDSFRQPYVHLPVHSPSQLSQLPDHSQRQRVLEGQS